MLDQARALVGNVGEPQTHFQIVGLVKDTKYQDLREEFMPIGYFPARQASYRAGPSTARWSLSGRASNRAWKRDARPSDQRMAGRSGVASARVTTNPCICPESPMPAIASAEIPRRRIPTTLIVTIFGFTWPARPAKDYRLRALTVVSAVLSRFCARFSLI